MDDKYVTAFNKAAKEHKLTGVRVDTHDVALQYVPSQVRIDLIVSPANSYGRLDGGFDDAISRALSPRDDYLALTKVAQARLYDEWRGFAPPGTCTLLRIPSEFEARSKNAWGTKYLALTPSMRIPQEVEWDREVVYECIWSLLCAIDKHNAAVDRGNLPKSEMVNSFLMTPLATGTGMVTAERWAAQAALAIKHFVDSKTNRQKWSGMQPGDMASYSKEVAKTWLM